MSKFTQLVDVMKILIVVATGNIGRHTVKHAMAAGHDVSAHARSPSKLEGESWFDGDKVRLVAGDIRSVDDVNKALPGHDAVIWTVGAPLTWNTITRVPDVCSVGTRHLVDAMQKHDVKRLVCLTAIELGDSKGSGRWVFRNVIQPLLLGRIHKDREQQESIVLASDLDWTIVRPAELTDKQLDGEVTAMTLPYGNAYLIQRDRVAEFLVREVTDNKYVRQPVLLSQ